MLSFSNTWILVCSIFLTSDTIDSHCLYITYSTEVSGFFISSLISLCSLNTLFTKANSSWLICESIRALDIRTSIVFDLSFLNNTILSCFFFFFFTIHLDFLITAMIVQIFMLTAEIIIPTGTETNEINTYMSSYIFHLLNYYVLFHIENNFLFHQFFLI